MLGQGSFDKLEIPESFQGTFRELFEVLLITFGAVAIGLNRQVKVVDHFCCWELLIQEVNFIFNFYVVGFLKMDQVM